MKLLLLDFEATDILPDKARPIEYCFYVWDTETGETLERDGLLWADDYPEIPEVIVKLTGITTEAARAGGKSPKEILEGFAKTAPMIDYCVAHNAHGYDKVLLEAECKRHGIELPKIRWIDTMLDVPFPPSIGKCRRLSHLALEHGIIVDPAKLHGAKADVGLMKSILQTYPIVDVVKFATAPWIVLQAMVHYDTRELAKKAGFGWEKIGEKVYPKTWVKRVRDFQLADELARAKEIGFGIRKIEG
jgi:hypothetical protein